MEKKVKKHEQILLKLKQIKRNNERYCYLNSCSPTPYMNGSNKIVDEMIEYILNLK